MDSKKKWEVVDISARVILILAIACFVFAVMAAFKLSHEIERKPEQEEQQTVEVETEVPVAIKTALIEEVAEEAEEEAETPFHYDCIPLTDEEQIALNEACERFGIDVALMCGLIYQETRFTNIEGDGGRSIGYCQVQPRWWHELMAEIGAEDLHIPADNFTTAAAILRRHYDAYGTWERALTAYNTGAPGSNGYARAVMGYWNEWIDKLEREG